MGKINTTTIEHSATRQLKALLALAHAPRAQSALLPSELADSAGLARHLTALSQGSEQSGEALLSTLCNRQTPLAALQGIKELAKTLAEKAGSEVERGAATLLYHAAVAAAFGHHGHNISSRSGGARLELYDDLAALMAGDPLGRVFQEAADRLEVQHASGKTAP